MLTNQYIEWDSNLADSICKCHDGANLTTPDFINKAINTGSIKHFKINKYYTEKY